MRKNNIIASILLFLAEYSLRGLKAWARRVMAEWLKTPRLVLSRDQSSTDTGLFLEDCGCVPTNPTKDAYFIMIRLLDYIISKCEKMREYLIMKQLPKACYDKKAKAESLKKWVNQSENSYK